MVLTIDQKKVVNERKKDILVSAAAGSGKTAVLVERIISKICDSENPADIDRILIVTFTKAAAAEMRQRIHEAILKKLKENPLDENLQRQDALIHHAMITTIDSFCNYLVRNHFHEIGLDPGFRMADNGEIGLLEAETVKEVLESFCMKMEELSDEDPQKIAFDEFMDSFSPVGKDEPIHKLILGLYKASRSHEAPMQWLAECKEQLSGGLEETVKSKWYEFYWTSLRSLIEDSVKLIQTALKISLDPNGPFIYTEMFQNELDMAKALLKAFDSEDFETRYQKLKEAADGLNFGRLSTKKDPKIDPDLKDAAKALRDEYKASLNKIKDEYVTRSFDEMLDLLFMADRRCLTLLEMAELFYETLDEKKKEQNILDFADVELKALEILYKDGAYTQTALEYQEFFDEVMIDEYQDSNMVQETILTAVAKQSKGNHNRFMVGDMKQSIYKFRLARPELFMDKYDTYQSDDTDNVLISLKKNFRSRQEVLSACNTVFDSVMKKEVGNITYDEDASLYLGAEYDWTSEYDIDPYFKEKENEPGRYQAELYCIEAEGRKADLNRENEARFLVSKIRELVGKFPVTDLKNKVVRKASYRDIVILVRGGDKIISTYKNTLLENGIPACVESKEGYFASNEISLIMDYLRIINNPYDEIALCSVLTSVFAEFSNELLAEIKIKSEKKNLYEGMLLIQAKEMDKCHPKITEFLNRLNSYRELSVHCNMTQLVTTVLQDYHYIEYVLSLPLGQQRRANVEMFLTKTIDFEKTSLQGLFQFIRYMDQLKKYEIDEGQAGVISDAMDAVRIMTIHKSKGLEFPICIVAALDKDFNKQDKSGAVLIDSDLGIAPVYVDLKKRVSGTTIKKLAVANKIDIEQHGEEIRVLYVAMTRAREKLIMTGVSAKVEELLDKYRLILESNPSIPTKYLSDAKNFLDYLLIACASNSVHLKCNMVSLSELGEEEIKEEISFMSRTRQYLEMTGDWDTYSSKEAKELLKQMKEQMSFEYPHQNLKGLYTKTSVSEIKKQTMEEEEVHPIFDTDIEVEHTLPKFMMKEKEEAKGAARGSAMHRFLELLDFVKYADILGDFDAGNASKEEKNEMSEKLLKELDEDKNSFVSEYRLTEEYADLIIMPKIETFLYSDIAHRMMKAARANLLYEEQPFVLSVAANRLNEDFPENETVLIQGIIDVFFEEDGKLIILDYKTDRVKEIRELEDRYHSQLEFYKEACSRITGKEVSEKVIYSFALDMDFTLK